MLTLTLTEFSQVRPGDTNSVPLVAIRKTSKAVLLFPCTCCRSTVRSYVAPAITCHRLQQASIRGKSTHRSKREWLLNGLLHLTEPSHWSTSVKASFTARHSMPIPAGNFADKIPIGTTGRTLACKSWSPRIQGSTGNLIESILIGK